VTALPAQSPAPATWVDTAPAPSGRVLHAAQVPLRLAGRLAA
jgi:hypothetical protein